MTENKSDIKSAQAPKAAPGPGGRRKGPASMADVLASAGSETP